MAVPCESDLGRLANRCRASAPGSNLSRLLAPEMESRASDAALLLGIDGFVELHKTGRRNCSGDAGGPGDSLGTPEIMPESSLSSRSAAGHAALPGHSLTAREGQVFQLLMRRLSNKEISSALEHFGTHRKIYVSNVSG